jgi:hypothetical protein
LGRSATGRGGGSRIQHMRYVYILTEITVVFHAYGVQCNTEGIYCSKLYQNVVVNLEEVFPTLIPSKSTIY